MSISPMSLKKTMISESILRDSELNEKVEAASKVLIDVLGNSAGQVSAIWELDRDPKGRSIVRLKIEDPWGKDEIEFAPDELESSNQMWWRLHRFWGNHLQAESQRLVQRLHESVSQMEDE